MFQDEICLKRVSKIVNAKVALVKPRPSLEALSAQKPRANFARGWLQKREESVIKRFLPRLSIKR